MLARTLLLLLLLLLLLNFSNDDNDDDGSFFMLLTCHKSLRKQRVEDFQKAILHRCHKTVVVKNVNRLFQFYRIIILLRRSF